MKRTRRMAMVTIAALALAGFLASFGPGVSGPGVVQARDGRMNGSVHGRAQANPHLALSRVDQGAGQQLTTGCNQITETGLPTGGKVADWLNQHVQPMSALISVWHYDNATQKYRAAWFYDPAVPVDVPTFTQPVDAFFVCVNASATAP